MSVSQQGEFTRNRKQVVNRLKIPQGLSTVCFIGGVKFPQGEGSAVVHRKKNDLLYETATPDVDRVIASGRVNSHLIVNRS